MESHSGCPKNEGYEVAVGKETPGLHALPHMGEDDEGVQHASTPAEQGEPPFNAGDRGDPRVLRLQERSSVILASLTSLLEDRKLEGLLRWGGLRGNDHGHSHPTQGGVKDQPDATRALLLEQVYEEMRHKTSSEGVLDGRNYPKLVHALNQIESALALGAKDGDPSVHRLRSAVGQDPRNHPSQGRRYAFGLRGDFQTNSGPNQAKWDGYLPCPVYLEDPKQSRKRCPEDVSKWKLHAPPVEPTSAHFPPEISRWLTRNDFTMNLAKRIDSEHLTMAKQISKATCDLPPDHLVELITKGFVKEWGEVSNPPEGTLFIGNVFLHPEAEKERWRLIFHPYWFNLIVRAGNYHSVQLPRMRTLLKQIDAFDCTVKIDLKCAFFQIKIQEGLFVFRKGGKLYTLTRLPMGASISVLVAQTLSLMVASEFTKRLGVSNGDARSNAFVDDIFCSFNPSSSMAPPDASVIEAMAGTVKALNVTLKVFQLGTKRQLFVRNPLSNPILGSDVVSGRGRSHRLELGGG